MAFRFGGLARAVGSGMQGADEIERQRKEDAEKSEAREIQKMAQMMAFREMGLMPESEAPTVSDDPVIQGFQGLKPKAVASVRTPRTDPDYKPIGTAGGQRYVQGPKPAEIVAQRQQAETIRKRMATLRALPQHRGSDPEALQAIAMDDDAWRDAIKPQASQRPNQPRTVESSEGIMQYDEDSGGWKNTGMKPFVPPQRDTGVQEDLKAQRAFTRTQALQGDYQKNAAVKTGYGLADVAAGIKAALAGDAAMDDLSIIYQTVKLFDPGSVVREGEISLMRSAQSLPQEARNLIQKWNTGKVLLPEMRQAISRLVDAKIAEQERNIAPVQRDFGEMARRHGVEADSAFIAPSPFRGLRAGQELSPADAALAKQDPDFAAWLKSRGVEVP